MVGGGFFQGEIAMCGRRVEVLRMSCGFELCELQWSGYIT